MNWTYADSDPAIMLWTAARERFGFDFRGGQRIVELGCAETDWLERVHRCDPTLDLLGIDARAQQRDPTGFQLRQGSALDSLLIPNASCDWVVMLGALEHFGLGFYGDPEMEDGDSQTMKNILDWLKPGGFCYFDVPAQPTFRITANRHYRCYGPEDITARLVPKGLTEINRAYSLPEPNAGVWCQEPEVEKVPYYYCAVLLQKDGR